SSDDSTIVVALTAIELVVQKIEKYLCLDVWTPQCTEGLTPPYTTLYIRLVKMHRTNLSLLPRHMKRLEEESKKTGASIAELVRRAIDNTYPEKAKAKAAAR